MYQRYLENRLPETSFFLFGPRQVGKSTLLHSENPQLIIDLLNPELQLSYNKSPNLLRQEIDELNPDVKIKILIDEVQRVPKLLDIVHAVMEQRPNLQFILCGSSARKLRHGAEVDLLISRGTKLLYAIECKFKRQPSSSDLSGLRSFRENHSNVPCFIVAPVNQSFRLSFARVFPPQKLFKELK